eukprot:scaffold240288_cov39-Prasinocladus_malaysianus.AAC.1
MQSRPTVPMLSTPSSSTARWARHHMPGWAATGRLLVASSGLVAGRTARRRMASPSWRLVAEGGGRGPRLIRCLTAIRLRGNMRSNTCYSQSAERNDMPT